MTDESPTISKPAQEISVRTSQAMSPTSSSKHTSRMLHQRDTISSERSESSDNEHLFPTFRVLRANSILGKRTDRSISSSKTPLLFDLKETSVIHVACQIYQLGYSIQLSWRLCNRPSQQIGRLAR